MDLIKPQASNINNDHDTASVRQHSKDTGSPFYTPERRTRAESAGSEQKYSHKLRLSTSVTLNTDHSEDESSDDTNESQHSELDETEKIYQHNIPENESEPNDMQQRIKTLSNRVLLRIFSMTSDTRQRVKQPERNNKFKKIIIDTYRDEYAIVGETEDLIVEYCVRVGWLVGFLTSSSTTRLYRGRAPRQSMRQSWDRVGRP